MNKKSGTKLAIILFSVLLFLAAAAFILFSSLYTHKNVPTNSTVSSSTKNYCTAASRDVQVCAQIFAPVCGYPTNKTFSNSCFACMNVSVDYYVRGQCS